MRRKLVEQGSTTLMVSLPKEWTNELNLKKGQEVDIQWQQQSLIVKANPEEKRSLDLVFTTEKESAIRFVIVNAYRAGWDILRIKYKTPQQFSIIMNVIKNYVVGLELTHSAEQSCTLENLTEPAADQFDMLFRKMLQNIALMIEQTKYRLSGEITFSEHHEVMQNVFRYDAFCRRILAKKHFLSENAVAYWQFSSQLLHAARELDNLHEYLKDENICFPTYSKKCEALQNLFKQIESAFREGKLEIVEKIHLLRQPILTTQLPNTTQELAIEYYLNVTFRNLHLATSPLTTLVFTSKKFD